MNPVLISGILFLVPQLVVLAACFYYLSQKARLDSILLTFGSLVETATQVYFSIIFPLKVTSYDATPNELLLGILKGLSTLARMSFAVGLFMAALIITKKKENAV